MNKKIKLLVEKLSDNADLLNKLVVSSFLYSHHIEINTGYLSQFVIQPNQISNEDLKKFFSVKSLEIEDVINIFELAVPKEERTSNGAVYTPRFIRDYVVDQVSLMSEKPLDRSLCADISCGCGAFLYTLSLKIHQISGKNFKSIYQDIYGFDISGTSIIRAKILLSLLALEKGECINEEDLNLYCCNSLEYNFMGIKKVNQNSGFDIIVGNPPYVRAKHIDNQSKILLNNWTTSKSGNSDLYIPFFEIGISCLHKKGILGYITVNSFFKTVNARALRKYFHENMYALKIIDFGQQLIFKKKLAYTCLVFLSKKKTDGVQYVKSQIIELEESNKIKFAKIPYDELKDHKGWNLNDLNILRNIKKIEEIGKSLGELYIIKNGIATLANDVFIFKPIKQDDQFYYLQREGNMYPIEIKICRDIIKPNILKSEADIEFKTEKIIFPYDNNARIIQETEFKSAFPMAYRYLESCREKLDKRDKGEGNYEAWFAFGRTQAIGDVGRKLLFPYMSDQPHFIYMPQESMMIYCGYAIYAQSESELKLLKRVLESCVFDYYIRNTSKPYSTGYYSYAKNYVKSFGIYPFNEDQKKDILYMKTRREIDDYLIKLYDLSL